jgi:ubiquinone/menaquinone biosynthesis C-methylase UbiE
VAPGGDLRVAEEDRIAVMEHVVEAPSEFYDERYRHGYGRQPIGSDSGYDACILTALRWAIERIRAEGHAPERILDLGCGQGRCMAELASDFPRAALVGADVSHVALDLARDRFPAAEYLALGNDGVVPAPHADFELIAMIEVIEHVVDAQAAANEIARLLRPGGWAILTTPCANAGSGAWWFNRLTGGFEQTLDGFGRFRTDEPAHLRRLRSRDLRALLRNAGLEVQAVRWWGHLATALADVAPGVHRLPLRARQALARLDWRLARALPTGAAMIAIARKP